MSQEHDITRVLDDMAGRSRAERLPDPGTLRRAADRRHGRRLAVAAAACVAAAVAVPLTVTMSGRDQSAPVSPPGFDCPVPAQGPRRDAWDRPGDALHQPGWVETFPAVPPHHKVEFTSVAANHTGYLVDGRTYAGELGSTLHDEAAKLWFSTDGRTWTSLRRPTGIGNALLGIDDTFYATGYAEDGSPTMWSTTDGRDWQSTRIADIPRRLGTPDSKGIYIHRVTCVDERLIAYGTDGGDDGTMAGWASTDGRHWSRLDPSGAILQALGPVDAPSLAGDGPAGTVAIPPWGDGWAPARIWFHRS